MYSKDRGFTYDRPNSFPHRESTYRQPAYRQPAYRQPDRPRMQVPPNYSGHAIVDGEERPLGHMAEVESPEEPPTPDLPTPHFDGLPRVSDLGDNHRRPSVRTVPATFEEPAGEGEDMEYTPPKEAPLPETPAPVAAPSAPVSVPAPERGGLFDLSRFPFGHGIGFEELLIIGLILFLLHENASCAERGDLDETVILLGLILLLG